MLSFVELYPRDDGTLVQITFNHFFSLINVSLLIVFGTGPRTPQNIYISQRSLPIERTFYLPPSRRGESLKASVPLVDPSTPKALHLLSIHTRSRSFSVVVRPSCHARRTSRPAAAVSARVRQRSNEISGIKCSDVTDRLNGRQCNSASDHEVLQHRTQGVLHVDRAQETRQEVVSENRALSAISRRGSGRRGGYYYSNFERGRRSVGFSRINQQRLRF
ncbi:hypothetical protein Zmor_022342 [Zophobas morio]|uniref:Uncharacterized protein n=1 Tax=Zophobas morio TaxID=2755281 RepID=A0AA38HV68_9CUCU|nr:hypothetical protein Zmor_022342 [Zophobas morio]